MNRLTLPLIAAILFLASHANASTWYIGTAGADTNAGGFATPFATLGRAYSAANAGDTIYVFGGTYTNFTARVRTTKSGTQASPINLFAYPGQTPILDFSAVTTASERGLQIDHDWWRVKGLTIQHAPNNGLFISGSNNIAEQIVTRWNGQTGLSISTSGGRIPSNNLVLNSDSYENYDPGNHGQDADGFSAKFRGLGTGNAFRGVRAWGNSDDGIDFWQAENGVILENSWFYKNGINIWGDTAFEGNGNGIKLGQDSGQHTVRNSMAWENRVRGVDVNGNATVNPALNPIAHGVTIQNVTSYHNGDRNFRFDDNFVHILRNNLSVAGGNTDNVQALNDDLNNSWNGISADINDFISVDDAMAVGPRLGNGDLPISSFLHLVAGSNLIDAGMNIGLPFNGLHPDLGAYEFGWVPEPSTTLPLLGLAIVMFRIPNRRDHRSSAVV